MKMHRMRLITTTNCPFGIEDDETVKGRQAGRKKRVERGEGGVTATGWAADMGRDINWLACHFVYAVCPVNARQLGCEIRKKSKKSEERRVRRASRTRRGARVQRAGNIIVSAHKAIKCLT